MKKDMTFNDYESLANGQGKSIRQAYKEVQASMESNMRGSSDLMDGYIKDTQYFHDSKFFTDASSAGLYPIDAFQVLDLTINLPLNKFWAQELVPMRMGGGAVESFAFFRSNVGLANARLAGGNSNSVPLVSISDEKVVVPIYPIRLGILLGDVDMMKSDQVNYGLLERHEQALRTSYWKEIELFAMQGNVNIGDITTSTDNFHPGLLNIPVSGAGIYYTIGTSEIWSSHDITEWTAKFITAVATMKKNLRYQRDYFPNKVLLPPTVWTLLQAPAVLGDVASSGGAGIAVSILEYIQTQIKKRLQIEVEFVELPYLDTNAVSTDGFFVEEDGAGSNGRIVLYRKDEKVMKLPIAMPLTGGAALPSPTEAGIRKNYLAFVGPLAIVYPEAIGYIDNKSS
jgi:hypothetical protein